MTARLHGRVSGRAPETRCDRSAFRQSFFRATPTPFAGGSADDGGACSGADSAAGAGEPSGIRRLLSKLVAGQEENRAMQAVWNGAVIAESDDTVVVEGNHYFPIEAVDPDVLQPSSHHTVCPWKGVASYYDIAIDGEVNRDAAWYYPKPTPPARKVANRVAFWNGVKVRAAE